MKYQIPIAATVALLASSAVAYVPAAPTNDTSAMNFSDSSTLGLEWYPRMVYTAPISYQLTAANGSTGGVDKGALVHFNEKLAGDNRTVSTPWIAFISCDYNETNASDGLDIFMLAKDRGAIAALLYSTTSQSCLLNAEYIKEFETPVDVFVTISRDRAGLIDDLFENTNQSFWYFDGPLLNASAAIINQSLISGDIPSRTFLIATLTAKNSIGQAEPKPMPASTSSSAARREAALWLWRR